MDLLSRILDPTNLKIGIEKIDMKNSTQSELYRHPLLFDI
jgi:hypothetical protein